MSNFQISIPKDEYEIIRVTLGNCNGSRLLSIREWYRLNTKDDFYPSKKGITINAVHFPEFLKALKEVQELLN